ncbi:MAG: hypothetical protein ACREOR_06910 [Candidatus Binatia bacterium]
MAQRAAEVYFRADPERAALLPILAQSNSTGAGWTDYHLLHRYIVVRRPSRILEFGSGRTTVVMAHALAATHLKFPKHPPGHLCSMEDVLRFHEDAKAIMPPQLSRYVTLIHSPKREATWRNEIWGFGYSELPSGPFNFVFVDGPTEYRDEEAIARGIKGACLDLLYLLEREPEVLLDVVVDQKFSSLEAYESVLPRGTIRYDPVMDVGVMDGVSGGMLGEHRTIDRVKRGDAWQILKLK